MPQESSSMDRRPGPKRGFTLIELVMVILLLAILAAIAIPNFIDFRSDARNSATNGALGAFRAAISIATASIALKEDPTIGTLPKYPNISEMWANQFLSAAPSSHPILAAASVNIMDPAQGYPKNPWTINTAQQPQFNSVYQCDAAPRGYVLAAPTDNQGWCYQSAAGTIWANSDRNGAAYTENTF